MIDVMLTKLVNEKLNNSDKHLGAILFAYHIAFKVNMRHTPFQLLYGLYLLMPTYFGNPNLPHSLKHKPNIK